MKPALPWYLRAPATGFGSTGCLFFFTLPFLAGGIACFWGMAGQSAADWWQARDWQAADAVIQKAWLRTSEDDEGDSYQVAAEFTYTHAGRRHQGTRHSFVHNTTNVGVKAMRETVRQLPAGKQVTCWVNPMNPAEAVIDRSLPGEVVVGTFFALPFLTIGGVGLCIPALPWLRRRQRALRRAELRTMAAEGRLAPWALDPITWSAGAARPDVALVIAQDERLAAALGLTFLNAFWNGIVAVFVSVAVISFSSGETVVAVLLSLFLIPFVAIGLGMLRTCFKHWRLIRRPRWVAACHPIPDLAGGRTEFSWAWLGTSMLPHLPAAQVRLVAMAGLWDEEWDSPLQTVGTKRRTRVSDPKATQKCELELTAMAIPLQDAAGTTLALELPPVLSPQAQLQALAAHSKERLTKVPWGAWWQLEVTYADGTVETADVTKPVKMA